MELKISGLEPLINVIKALETATREHIKVTRALAGATATEEPNGGVQTAPATDAPATAEATAEDPPKKRKRRTKAEMEAARAAEAAAKAAEGQTVQDTITRETVLKRYADFFDHDKTADGQKLLIQAARPILEHFGLQRLREISETQAVLEEALEYANGLIAAFEADGLPGVRQHRFPFQEESVEDVL